jgi:hypothetical protein
VREAVCAVTSGYLVFLAMLRWRYGGVIKRTGTGEVPESPMTGVTPLFVELLLQPAILST